MRRLGLVALLLLASSLAEAQARLDLSGWLARPGVRAVAVEFYATWCKPCMEAMPRWKALREKYGRQGLRVVVINTRDASGSCAIPNWTPDQTVCDLEGVLADRFGVGDLPAAFLWSWRGDLLVPGGHIGEVEAAVEKLMAELPRVLVESTGDVPADVLADVRRRLADARKLEVVANADEAKRLAQLRDKFRQLSPDDGEGCGVSSEERADPNTWLKVSRAGDQLALELFSIERGCQVASAVVAWDDEDRSSMVRDGVETLLARLRRTEPEPPRVAVVERTGPAPAVSRAGQLEVSTNVADALLTIDGQPRAGALSARKVVLELPAGEHRVRVSASGYLEHLVTVAVPAGGRVQVSATLVTEQRRPTGATKAAAGNTLLQLSTKPSGAVLVIDGKVVGKAPLDLELPPGRHTVTARLNWYKETTAQITLEPDLPFARELELAPDFGKLEITSATPGVAIALEGRAEGVANPTLARSPLSPGTYRLTATLANHHEYVEQVTIRAGETTRVKLPALRTAVGALRIETTPPGAEVELDGVARGRSPLVVRDLPGGAHELKVTLADHVPVEQPVEVAEGAESPITVRMESLLAELRVDADPVGARVFVDGREVGQAPFRQSFREGDHTLRVEVEGYLPNERRLTFVRGRPQSISVRLDKAYGQLLVVTRPFGAKVRLDGEVVGVSPLKRPQVQVGSHTLEVSLEDHRTIRRDVRVGFNEQARVDVELTELLPREKAEQRMKAWKETYDRQGGVVSWWRSSALVGAGLTGVAAIGWAVARGSEASTADTYRSMRSGDFEAAYRDYSGATLTAQGWLVGAAAVAVCSLVAGSISVVEALKLPVRPTFEVEGQRSTFGVQGEW